LYKKTEEHFEKVKKEWDALHPHPPSKIASLNNKSDLAPVWKALVEIEHDLKQLNEKELN